ncbi:MAG TPA: cyanophycin synthetase, partial [Longimicrobiales bacterium]
GSEAPRWTAHDVEFAADATRFRVTHAGVHWGDVVTPLAGEFNVRNCLAAIGAAVAAGAEPAGILEGLRTFKSVRRRMEVRGEVKGITVIDDFAHHPTAVRETIKAARQKYTGRPIVAVFEPRSYTAQRREFQDDYARAFADAQTVIMAGLFHPERYTSQTALDPNQLVDWWRGEGKTAEYIPEPDRIVEFLVGSLKGNEVVLIMSNGGFGGIHGKLLDALVKK